MLRKLNIVMLAVLVVAGLSACTRSPVVRLYSGPKKPKSEIAVVRVPMELNVLTINKRHVDHINTLFSIGYKDLHMKPGRYEIVAYYDDVWDLPGDSHEVVKSDPAVFTVDAKAGHFYKLGYPKPKDLDAAHKLAHHFDGWVEDITTGKRTPTKPSGLVLNSGFTSSLKTIAGQEPSTNQTKQAAANDNAVEPEPSNDKAAGSGSYLDMLKASWNQATKKERREFLQWVGQQSK